MYFINCVVCERSYAAKQTLDFAINFFLPNPDDVGILPTIMNLVFAHSHHSHHHIPPQDRETLCAYLN